MNRRFSACSFAGFRSGSGFHLPVNDGDRRKTDTDHKCEQEDFDKEHEPEGVVEKLLEAIDPGPRQVYAAQCEHRHARQPEEPLRSGDPFGQSSRLDEDVNIEDRTEKNDGRQKMNVADDKTEGPVNRPLEFFGLDQDSLGDRIAVPVSDVGKTGRFELAAGALGMAENAPLSGLAGVFLGGRNRKGAQRNHPHQHDECEAPRMVEHPASFYRMNLFDGDHRAVGFQNNVLCCGAQQQLSDL